MMRSKTNKKAISPIIAVFMLIVVTLVIGALVTAMSRNYISKGKTDVMMGKTDMRCGVDVAITVPEIAGQYRLCKETDTTPASVNFTIQNAGALLIDDLQVKLYTDKEPIQNDSVLLEALDQGEMQAVSVTYDSDTYSLIKQINIVPRIKKPGQTEEIFCEESQLVFKEISECS